jgi:GT2 family glycosyltransferase
MNGGSQESGVDCIVVLPQAVVYHVGGATLGYENPRKTFLNFRNNLLMLRKNLPYKRLRWVMIVRFFMDYLAALQMLVTGQVSNAKAVFKARCAYHQMKKQYPISHSESPMAEKMLARRSVVWDFYVMRKRK